jgi:hypothetical protein
LSAKLVLATLLMILLTAVGCASLDEGYTARYGLTNPENPPVHPDLMDETYGGGIVGQQEIEEYDKKYHEQDIFKPAPSEPSQEQEQPTE